MGYNSSTCIGIKALLSLMSLTFGMESFKVIAFHFSLNPLSYMLGKLKGYNYLRAIIMGMTNEKQ